MKDTKLERIQEENQRMISHINQQIRHGVKYYSNTYLGKLEIDSIDSNLWIHCPHTNGGFGRSFAIHGGELKDLYNTHFIA